MLKPEEIFIEHPEPWVRIGQGGIGTRLVDGNGKVIISDMVSDHALVALEAFAKALTPQQRVTFGGKSPT